MPSHFEVELFCLCFDYYVVLKVLFLFFSSSFCVNNNMLCFSMNVVAYLLSLHNCCLSNVCLQ